MPDQSSAASEHALIQEITAPLETLPDDALALVEADFPSAMRGYDRHAVDDYVMQMSRLVAELQATRSPEAAVRRALERVGDQISGILQRAHQTAEQITAQSRGEAEDRMEQARREAASIIDAAEDRVRELDADADRVWAERQRIIADAEGLSAQLLSVARDAAERFPPVESVESPEGLDRLGALDEPGEPEGLDGPGPLDEPEEPELAVREPAEIAGADEPEVAPDEENEVAPGEEPELLVDDADADAADEAMGDGEDPYPETDEWASDDVEEPGDDAGEPGDDAEDPGIERTVPYRPAGRAGEPPTPRRLTDDDSTQIIPPASDAAQHRRDG